MIIEINKKLILNVFEQCLVVKDGKLFNTNTNEYEAIDGDKVKFCFTNAFGIDCWVSGTVDRYTCNRRIKLRGIHDLYAIKHGTKKTIKHLSVITDSDCKDNEADAYEEMMKAEWEAALSE